MPFFVGFDFMAFEISPHSMEALRTLDIVPSPLQVTRSEQEIILKTTLAFHGNRRAGTTDAIELRISITKQSDYEAEACFSVKGVGVTVSGSSDSSSIGGSTGAPDHAAVDTPHISGGFLNLGHRDDIRMIIPLKAYDMLRRTLVSTTEYTVHPETPRGGMDWLLRIALQHSNFARLDGPSLPIWLSIEIS